MIFNRSNPATNRSRTASSRSGAAESSRDKKRLLEPGGAPGGQRSGKMANGGLRPAPGLAEGRLQFVSGFFMLVFGILVVRAADLTIWQGDHLRAKAEDQHKKKIVVPAHRGRILDRNGRPLAISLPVETISLDGDRLGSQDSPERKQEIKRLAKKLAPLLGIERKTLTTKLENTAKGAFPTLQRKVPPEIAKKIKESNEPALFYLPEMQRFYPMGEITAHILGFTDMEGQGVEGMERAMNGRLTGQPGLRMVTRDRLGRLMPEAHTIAAARPGTDLLLTVDAAIQYIAYRALMRAVAKYEAAGGTVIVMNPENGHVLAMANQPGFNPNNLSSSAAAARRNRAIADLYEPGSTFKVFTIAAALDHGTVKPDTQINCENGFFRVGNRTIKDHTRHELLSVSQVLQKSSNIGSAKIGLSLGNPTQENYLRAFGFAKPTGIELAYEATGRIPDIRHYPVVGLANRSFGQGISATPIQLVTAMAAAVNGGLHYTPRIVAGEMVDGQSLRYPDAVPRQVIKPETSAMIRVMLSTVVSQEGTALSAAIPGYEVGGKTGTAQKASATGGYEEHDYFSSFIGLVPADKPKLVIFVGLDEPRGQYYGGVVAAPVFREIAEEILPMLVIPTKQDKSPGLPEMRADTPLQTDQVVGRSLADALRLLGEKGIVPQVKGSGLVAELDKARDGQHLTLH